MSEPMKVEQIAKAGLCCRCGTCAGLCPQQNIEAIRNVDGDYCFRTVNKEKCQRCSGICYKVCPGHSVDNNYFNIQLFGELPQDYSMGVVRSTYAVASSDEQVLAAASAGGAVSQICISLLESGQVDGVLSCAVGGESGMVPQIYIARTREDILRAAQSKYYPIPKNLLLREITKSRERFAFVGLPCQIQGIRKGQDVYPKLSEQITFTIGLFCGRCPSYKAARFIMEKSGIQENEVISLVHRQGPYPGSYWITCKDGRMINADAQKMIGFGGILFMDSNRCLTCNDLLSELSDLSVGDIIRQDLVGAPYYNAVIARSKQGEDIIRELLVSEALKGKEIPPDIVRVAQIRGLVNKKRGHAARSRILSLLPGQQVPRYSNQAPKEWRPRGMDYLGGLLQIILISFARTKAAYRFLRHFRCEQLHHLCAGIFRISTKEYK